MPASCCMSRVPPELVDLIIDHLHDDRTSLTYCSLVSRHWLPASRTHLYGKLRLTVLTPSDTPLYRNSVHRLRGTFDILSCSPHLVGYIHQLHLGCFNTSWGRVDSVVPRILALLISVREFTVRMMVWADTGELDHFRSVCRFDGLTSVNFQSCEFPAPSALDSFLAPFAQLEYVQLAAITFRDARHEYDSKRAPVQWEMALDPNRNRNSRLRRINSSVETFHEWALRSPNLVYMKGLCTLQVSDLHTENFAHVKEILRVTSGSLEELGLVAFTELDLHGAHVVDVGTIRRLKLYDGAKTLPRSGRPMAWISPLLSRISEINELEEVEYVVGPPVGSPRRPHAIPVHHSDAGWAELDRILTGRKFARLEKFTISFDSRGYEDYGVDAFFQGMIHRMPLLHARGPSRLSRGPDKDWITWEISKPKPLEETCSCSSLGGSWCK